MPPSTGTRSQAQTRYARLHKCATTVRPTNEMAATLVETAWTVLEVYPIEANVKPPPEEVKALMQSLLPSPAEIFTESFLRSPLFAVVLLKDIADLYEFVNIDDSFLQALELSPYETGSENIMTHVWFAYLAGCDYAATRSLVECYKRTRGSPNIFLRHGRGPQDAGKIPWFDQARTSSQPPNIIPPPPGKGNSAQGFGPPPTPNRDPNGITPRDPPPANPPRRPSPSPEEHDDSRKATYVHQYFKDRKYAGDIAQSIELFLRDYNVCARQHKLTRTQRI